jgi:cardiolipin synthase C
MKKFSIALILLSCLGTSAWSDDSYRVAPYYKESEKAHQLTFLHRGKSSLQYRLDVIESAQRSIEFEYFIVHADPTSRLILQALVRKAREGVKVRVLLDHFFVGPQITPYHAEALREAGVEFRYYNPVPLIDTKAIHYRNHRKLISVDDRLAIIGGRNLRDRYFDMHADYNYIDRDMVVEGELVKTIRKSFDVYWNSPQSLAPDTPRKPQVRDLTYQRGSRAQRLRRFQDDLQRYRRLKAEAREFITPSVTDQFLLNRVAKATAGEMKSLPTGQCNNLVFATDVPGVGAWSQERRYRLSSEVTFEWMRTANKEIYMESPFVIINQQTSDLLDELLDRSIDIKIMTNSFYSTDLILTSAVFYDRASSWIRKGIEFAVYSGDVMPQHNIFPDLAGNSRWGIHSKSKIIDDSFMVGSLNFDPRSFNWSSELVLICHDQSLTEMLRESIDKRWENSIELKTPEKVTRYRFDRVNFINRLGYYLIKYPASLLDYHL